MRDLSRLLRPRSIAVIGGGAWCASVVEQCLKAGFDGPIWPIHPSKPTIAGITAYPSLDDLPNPPDAAFVGVNRTLTISMVAQLSTMGAGGAVCFASGFQEAQAETGDGQVLQQDLLQAAGDMPIIGPNCYGFINYLDGALLWPDQHGGQTVETGVAVITQSSNMAINITMQRRGLPLAYVLTAGNQAQIGLADLGRAVLADDRVTALGLHIEGVGDVRAFEALAQDAAARGKRIVVLKSGRSEQARSATVSHTASLAGSDAGADALFDRLGLVRVNSLPELLESLKLLHLTGGLRSNRVLSMSCSGGEASLMADTAEGRGIVLPKLSDVQKTALRQALGPMVALANPLDYHTFIWNKVDEMAQTFAAMMRGDAGIACLIVDFPRPDRCDPSAWDCILPAAARARQSGDMPLALVSTLPDAFPEDLAEQAVQMGLIPLMGLPEAIRAIEAAASPAPAPAAPLLLPGEERMADVLDEARAKTLLAEFGLQIPRAQRADRAEDVAKITAEIVDQSDGPVVIKSMGLAHKSDQGGVALGIMDAEQALAAVDQMPGISFLVEEMITGTVAELLIGVVRDPAHGFVLTLGMGGVLTEIMGDSTSLLLPTDPEAIKHALSHLRIAPLLAGYRGKAGVDMDSVTAAVMAVQSFVMAHADAVEEVEINPLICTPERAVAADALIRMGE